MDRFYIPHLCIRTSTRRTIPQPSSHLLHVTCVYTSRIVHVPLMPSHLIVASISHCIYSIFECLANKPIVRCFLSRVSSAPSGFRSAIPVTCIGKLHALLHPAHVPRSLQPPRPHDTYSALLSCSIQRFNASRNILPQNPENYQQACILRPDACLIKMLRWK